MHDREINQFGCKPIYIERNEGNIYVGENYVEEPTIAFYNGSYELYDYSPQIEPVIPRKEVGMILEWIERKATAEKTARLALLYGKAGIGKSVVMHNLLEELQSRDDYLVLGLKSDQVKFVDTDELSHKLHLEQPIEIVVKEMAQKCRRVVILIDQIDALSLSLSSNRMPLRSLLKVISLVQNVPNVRVVISCRPYDLEYDPLLNNLRIKNKWELKELSMEQVIQTLKDNQCNERLSDNLLRFLGNPLHLYLFLKVNPYDQLTTPLSTDLLYHQLWRKYINNDSERKVEKNGLLSLLDNLVGTMYRRQELSVHIREYETRYDAELRYLFTCGFLIMTKGGQIQFFHQTLFDYVYARRFTENNHKLLDELRGQHQGLFSRAAVKSILTFLREQDKQEYIRTVEQLLYGKDDNGKNLYRYHLKSLALSNMAFFEVPLPEELSLITRKLYYDKTYYFVILESIYTSNWFKAIWDVIDSKGGWNSLSKEYKEKTMVMCQRSLWTNTETVLDKLDSIIDFNDNEDCNLLNNLLQHYNLNCSSEKLISFYNRLVKSRNPMEYTHLLRNILEDNPLFVCEELKENVRLQLKEKNDKYYDRISFKHDEEELFEEMLKNHHEEAIQLFVDILTIIYDETDFKIGGEEIYFSSDFFCFQRTTGEYLSSNFTEDAVNILIDDFIKNVKDEKTQQYISEFSQSKHAGFVFIALYVYTARPDLFKDDICDVVLHRQLLSNAPSWVEYQAVEALKATFMLWDDEQKTAVIDRILRIVDKGEGQMFRDTVANRLQYGHPLLDIDLHKGKALKVIPIEELRRLSWRAYQERQRIDRKFNALRLENSKPSSMSTHVGWTSLKEEQGLKMSCDLWLNSMLKYNTDPHDWEKPSLTGQCGLFRSVVSKDPDKFIDLISQTVRDVRIQLSYPISGMQGLLDAGRVDDAMHVLKEILNVIYNDINTTVRGFSLHTLLFALNDIPKKEHVPETAFELFCNALINCKEPDEDRHQEDKDVHNVGVNQPRGNAGYMLVECAHEKKYKEAIFSTIESIVGTASVYTRAAILLNMAALNLLDKNRNVELFKRLMYDYNPRLMALPVHNYNPLVYFVNYAVDELMDFFSHAVDIPECYEEQVVILWLAWSHNDRDDRIKAFLDKICDTSQEARISLLNFLGTIEKDVNDDAIYYILHFMESQFDTPEMGEAFDNLFHHIDKWPDNIQLKITEEYVYSPLSKHQIRTFIGYLGGYAIKDPVLTLKWLELILEADIPDDFYIWNRIVDVVIQSYNGIKSFNDSSYQEILDHAMDLIDTIMQNPSNKNLISNFINKLDNE